jgi:hypothetical protein
LTYRYHIRKSFLTPGKDPVREFALNLPQLSDKAMLVHQSAIDWVA